MRPEPKERTCKSLFDEFKERYTIDEVQQCPQLAKLFAYLQHRCSMANGGYIHHPVDEIRNLLITFLNYNPEL